MPKEINLLYGPPASGKTSVAQEASVNIGVEYLSVGDMTRKEIQAGTPRGVELKRCLDEVVEYPVELIAGLVEEEILRAQDEGRGFILDGYPKYPREAEAFAGFLEAHGQRIDSIVILHIPMEDAYSRVQNRRICDECLRQFNITQPPPTDHQSCGGLLVIREDDTKPVFERRYGDFETSIVETVRILAPYTEKIINVNASTQKAEVVESVVCALNGKNGPVTVSNSQNTVNTTNQFQQMNPVSDGIHKA